MKTMRLNNGIECPAVGIGTKMFRHLEMGW